MSPPFNPGDKVVCIEGQWEPTQDGMYAEIPVEGVVYTVRDCSDMDPVTGVPFGEDAWWVDVGVNAAPFPGHHYAGFRPIRPNEAAAHESWSELLRNPQPEGVE